MGAGGAALEAAAGNALVNLASNGNRQHSCLQERMGMAQSCLGPQAVACATDTLIEITGFGGFSFAAAFGAFWEKHVIPPFLSDGTAPSAL